jgi:hypothetical protein
MDVQKKKLLQEKIYKLSQPSLRKIVQHIIQSNPTIKYTKNLNGYFFNMSFIDDTTLMQVYDIVCNCENPAASPAKE